MNWIKVKAEHNTQELSDAQFGSLVRYQLLIARIGRTPTEKEIRRETSIKTLRGAEQVLSSIGVTLDHIESKVIEDRFHVNSKRDAGKERVHSYRDRAKCNALPKQLRNDTDKIREDKSILKDTLVSKKFIPPTLEEVITYAKQRNHSSIANKFFDYYDVSNWKDFKGNAIKNWKQKFITWENNNSEDNAKTKEELIWEARCAN